MNTIPYYSEGEIEKLRQHFYANSPFDLNSTNDNKYRDAVDETLGEPVLCRDCGGTGIDVKKHTHCKRCNCTGNEPQEAVPVSYKEAVDAIYLAQRELREFYLPNQSEAMRVLNSLIKRIEDRKRG